MPSRKVTKVSIAVPPVRRSKRKRTTPKKAEGPSHSSKRKKSIGGTKRASGTTITLERRDTPEKDDDDDGDDYDKENDDDNEDDDDEDDDNDEDDMDDNFGDMEYDHDTEMEQQSRLELQDIIVDMMASTKHKDEDLAEDSDDSGDDDIKVLKMVENVGYMDAKDGTGKEEQNGSGSGLDLDEIMFNMMNSTKHKRHNAERAAVDLEIYEKDGTASEVSSFKSSDMGPQHIYIPVNLICLRWRLMNCWFISVAQALVSLHRFSTLFTDHHLAQVPFLATYIEVCHVILNFLKCTQVA
jgi:hypothetical protein